MLKETENKAIDDEQETIKRINKIVGAVVEDEAAIKSGKKPVDSREVSFDTMEIRKIIMQDTLIKKLNEDFEDEKMMDRIINEVISETSGNVNPTKSQSVEDTNEAENNEIDGQDNFVKTSSDYNSDEQVKFADIFDKVKKERLEKKIADDRKRALVKDKSDEAKNRIKQILANTDTLELAALSNENINKIKKEAKMSEKSNTVTPKIKPSLDKNIEVVQEPIKPSEPKVVTEQSSEPALKTEINAKTESKPEIKEDKSKTNSFTTDDEFMFIEDYDGDFPEIGGEIEHDELDIGIEMVNSNTPPQVDMGVIEQKSVSVEELKELVKENEPDSTPEDIDKSEAIIKKDKNQKSTVVKNEVEIKKEIKPIDDIPKEEEKPLKEVISDKAKSQVKDLMSKAVMAIEAKEEKAKEPVELSDDFENKWNEDWHEETQEVLLGATMQFDKITSLIDKERKASVLNRKSSTFEDLDSETRRDNSNANMAPSIKSAVDVGIDMSGKKGIKETTKNDLLQAGQKINIFEANFMETAGGEKQEEQPVQYATRSDLDSEEIEDKNLYEVETKESKTEQTEQTETNEGNSSPQNTENETNKETFNQQSRDKFLLKLRSNAKLFNREIQNNQIKVVTDSFTDVLRNECKQSAKLLGLETNQVNTSQEPIKIEKDVVDEGHKVEDEKAKVRKKNKFVDIILTAIKENILEDQSADNIKSTSKGVISDYESKSDAPAIRKELILTQRRLLLRTGITAILAIVSLILALIYRLNIPMISEALKGSPLTYILLNFALLIGAGIVCKNTLKNGLTSILRWKGSSDTVVSFLALVCGVQCFIALFTADQFASGGLVIYVLLALLGLFFNSWGKLTVVRRIFNNFKFITSNKEKMSAKIYTDEDNAVEMFSGVGTYTPVIAYQKPTAFLKDFLKLSYEPDPSEKFAGKIALAGVIISILVGVGYALITKNASAGITAIALTAALSYPVASILAINKPISNLCDKANKMNAMIVGYPSVQQFCDTNAVIISAKELYPKACVEFHGIKGFTTYAVDKAILEAAAVIIRSESPLAPIFNDLVKDNLRILPVVEKMHYEDDMGIEAWVKGRRILIGNRIIMENHGITPPSRDEERDFTMGGRRQVTYIAAANELLAMIITSYKPSDTMIREMQRLEDNGISFLVTTEDSNITPKLISEHFRVFFRSVKVLPDEISKKFTKTEHVKEEESRAYFATDGKISAFSRIISACVRVRSNVTASVITQAMSVILGLLIALALTFSAGIEHLNAIEMFIYSIFWALAALAVPYIRRP